MSTNWITLSQSAGTGNQQVTVAADANSSTEQRTLRLVIIAGDQTKYVFIQQAGAPIRMVRIYFNAASAVVVPYTGGTASYNQSRFMVMAEYNDGTTRQIGDVTITGTSTTISTVNTGITTQLVSQLSATATYSGSSATTILTASTTIDVMQQPAPETNRITYSASAPIVFTNDAVNNFGANIIASGYSNGSGAYIFDNQVARFYGNASCMITPATKGALTEITVPSSIANLGQSVFNGCSALTSVYGLEYTENVYLPPANSGNDAFRNCTSLTHCGLPHSYQYWSGGAIKADVFYGCSSLTTIIYNGTMAEWNAISKNSNWRRNSAVRYVQCTDGTIDLDPPQYATITYYAPEQLTIADSAITPSITSHTFSDGVGTIKAPSDITEINRSGFTNCTGMTGIELPDSVEAIHSYAFTSAMSLTTITIPENVTVLGDSVFWRCTGLTSVNIPTGITTINESTFSTCSSLTGITIPDNITTIDAYAFYRCDSLEEITIPSSVTTIGSYSFSRCSDLATINYGGTMAQWDNVLKYGGWHYLSPVTVVHCTDGDVPL